MLKVTFKVLFAMSLCTSAPIAVAASTNYQVRFFSPGVRATVKILDVAVGDEYSLVKKTDGTWWGAGRNWAGSLGLGDNVDRTIYTKIPAITGATKVLSKLASTYALMPDGRVLAAGYNNGTFGNGGTTYGYSFTALPLPSDIDQIAVTGESFFAHSRASGWFGAGQNYFGSLGVGDNNPRYTFVPVPALATAVQVIGGQYTIYAKLASGAWWAGGMNVDGAPGGAAPYRTTYQLVSNIPSNYTVYAGTELFIKSPTNTWLAAGDNTYAGLGIGPTPPYSVDVLTARPDLNGATKAACGYRHCYVKFKDGFWYGTGQNIYGLYGVPFDPDYFVKMPGTSGALEAYVGDYFSILMFSGGSIIGGGSALATGVSTEPYLYNFRTLFP